MCHLSETFDVRKEVRARLTAEMRDAWHGVMILDSTGAVRECQPETARLFSADARSLLGARVGELIHVLPFNPDTIGYNIAYATYWESKGMRSGFRGVDSRGRFFRLNVAVGHLVRAQRHEILLHLQLPADAARVSHVYAPPRSVARTYADPPQIPA